MPSSGSTLGLPMSHPPLPGSQGCACVQSCASRLCTSGDLPVLGGVALPHRWPLECFDLWIWCCYRCHIIHTAQQPADQYWDTCFLELSFCGSQLTCARSKNECLLVWHLGTSQLTQARVPDQKTGPKNRIQSEAQVVSVISGCPA